MSSRYVWTLIVLLAGLEGLALAQTQQTGDQDTQSQGAPQTGDDSGTARSTPAPALSGIVGMESELGGSDQDAPQIPGFLGGQGNRALLAGELERSNYLRGGVSVSEGYVDNAFLTPTDQVGNATFSVYPNISIAQSTTRARWSLDYAAGLTVNQRLTNQNQGAQSLTFNSLFALSPHLTLHAAESFSMISGLFGGNAASEFQPGFQGGNNTLISPLSNQKVSQTVVEANYHFALRDVAGASGGFLDMRYGDVASNATNPPTDLTNTQAASGTAFWLHQITQKNWAGFSYRYQRITYTPSGDTRVHTFAFNDTLKISKLFNISGFIGPEFSDNTGLVTTTSGNTQISTSSGWGVAGGVDVGWESSRTGVIAGYSKQVTNGSGILGAVTLQNGYVTVRRELFPRWTINGMVNYGNNQAITLALATTASTINTTTVGVMLDRNVGRSLGFQIGYFHDIQDQSGSSVAAQNYTADRNRVFVNLSYQWAKALGR
jgi:hypothetical protein